MTITELQAKIDQCFAACEAASARMKKTGYPDLDFWEQHRRHSILYIIKWGHADEVRRALRECGVYEAGEVAQC